METLEVLRRRLDSVEDMQSIVKTMKVLSAVSIRQFEEAAESVDQYMKTIAMGFQVLRFNETLAPLMFSGNGPPETAAFIIFGSGHGMCGRFNDQLAEFAVGEIANRRRTNHRLLAMGSYIADVMAAEGREVDQQMDLPQGVSGITQSVNELLFEIDRWRQEIGVDQVFLIYHHPTAGMGSEPSIQQLLPIDRKWLGELAGDRWPTNNLPTYRASGRELMTGLIREYLFVSLYRAFADSLASEHASRLASMQRAERKVDERREELYNLYHRERQRKVTEEVLDVMGGYLAISG
jgi:F-type H+-transporting ATPase subunit gamma